MIPVVTPQEMARVDKRAPEPVEVLIERAGTAVAGAAARLMGGIYGKRVLVVAGKGNNGADGRAAGRVLLRRGAKVVVLDAADLAAGAAGAGPAGAGPAGVGLVRLPPADLVIDAAYGTGLRHPYEPPDPGQAPVLAVDIPSGVSGLTGEVLGTREGGTPGLQLAVRASLTVTFAAMKPGLLLGEGAQRAGRVELADIGLGALAAEEARAWLVTDEDVAAGLPPRAPESHKWQTALEVIAGSPGMTGAAWLVSHSALRTGAGYVRLGMPGVDPAAAALPPGELVSKALPAEGWAEVALEGIERFSAAVIGPGLGSSAGSGQEPSGLEPSDKRGASSPVGEFLARAPLPVVVDADALNALGSLDAVAAVVGRRTHPLVLTPHAGEFTRLAGAPPGPDRIASVREAAARSGAIVLLKGSTTVVAEPEGRVLLAASGSPRLATAGTGDALSGVIGALIARGMAPFEAAGYGAHVHGRAAGAGRPEGLVASDLPELVSEWLSRVAH